MAHWGIIVACPPGEEPILVDGPTCDIAALREKYDRKLDASADDPNAIPSQLVTEREGTRKRGRITVNGMISTPTKKSKSYTNVK